MDLHLEIDSSTGRLAAQVAAGLREAIWTGRLTPGSRLPATRQLANDLGISRGVVVDAYEQLSAEGFLHTRVGSGTVVSGSASAMPGQHRQPPAQQDAAVTYELRPGTPDLRLFPRERWLTRLRQVWNTLPHEALGYPDHAGAAALRQALATYLNRVRAAQATPEDVVVTTGVAMALSLLARVLYGLGHQVVAVEDPSGTEYRRLLAAAGVAVIPVPVDEEGLDVHALAETPARVVVLTPAHQYPTGVVLSARRRASLIAWATERDGMIIEDDYDAEFRFDREPVGSLHGLAPKHVVLTGSVSKSLAPAMRIGWLVAPPALAQAVQDMRRVVDLGSPVVEQHALARFLDDGGYDRHLRTARRIYRKRRNALVYALSSHLPQFEVTGVSAGLHLQARLPASMDDTIVAALAREQGVGVLPVSPMRTAAGSPGLVLCFAREPEERLTQAVRLLSQSIAA